MTIDKRMKYEMQGGVKNYKPSKMVTAPKTAKSSPNHPTAHLAYITNKEKDLLIKKNLYGSLKGKPNRGPAGIPSLQGDFGGGSYGGHEGADRSGSRDRGTGDYGVSNKAVQDAYNKNRAIREANERAVDKLAGRDTRLSGGINTTSRFGGLGGLLRGALGIFGGIPGQLLSGILGAKNWAKNKGQAFGEGVEEFGNYPTLDRYLNRKTDKYKDKPYLGQGKTNYSFDGPTLGNDFGLFTDRQTAPIGPGKRVGQDQGYYGMGSRYDRSRMPNAPSYSMDDQFLDQNPETRNMLGINRSYTTPVNTNTYEAEPIGFIESLKNKFGKDVTPVGMNQEQIDFLNAIDTQNKAVGYSGLSTTHKSERNPEWQAGGFFENTSPTDVWGSIQSLNPKSRSLGFTGLNFDPDKIVSGDTSTFAQPDEVTSYLQGLSPEDKTYSWGLRENEPGVDYTDLARGGRVGYADGGLATLFTRRG